MFEGRGVVEFSFVVSRYTSLCPTIPGPVVGTGYTAVNKAELLILGCRIRGRWVRTVLKTLDRGL